MFSMGRSFLRANRRAGSNLALAIALATGAAIGVAGYAEPAYAKKKEKAAKADYSKAFVEAYQPLANKVNAEGADVAALSGEVKGLVGLAETDDDRFAAAQLMYSAGAKSKNLEMQREGMEMMLASGKVAPEQLGTYNFVAGQLAFNMKDYATARQRIMTAMENGYTSNDPQILIAETYFNEDKNAEGLSYLDQAINGRKAAGAEIPENWLKRGLTVSYRNSLVPQSRQYVAWLVSLYPSKDAWGDAVAIERTSVAYDDQSQLDLLRLARRVDGLRSERDYVDYLSAADARRLPGEVDAVVKEGIAAGILNTSDVFVSEAKSTSAGRIAADRADLPSLERDARKPDSSAITAAAAGDVFLSYNEDAKAEEMYKIALTKPGVDTQRVLTRLGITQVDQGKYAEAMETLAKVEGSRKPIADLWMLYAKQESGGDTMAAM